MLDFSLNADLWRYLSMPVITAVVGYITNVAAIWMMFHPLRFIGWSRFNIGWQGVVPRQASKMAGIAVDTITETLLDRRDIVDRLDPEAVAERLRAPAEAAAAEVTEQVMRERHPVVWETLPGPVRAQIKRRAREQAVPVVRDLLRELREHVDALLDLKSLVTSALVHDKRLLNQIFLETGRAEFVFIGYAGGYFGFAFGLLQLSAWAAWQQWWLLPLFGMLVGGTTNWLALKMIFNPRRARALGPLRIQGLFFQRQYEVSHEYARLVAERILTPRRIADQIFEGPTAAKFDAVLARHVERAIDHAVGPFVSLAANGAVPVEYAGIKTAAVRGLRGRLPDIIEHADGYLAQRAAIATTLGQRLRALTPAQFEQMLRPAFEQDEWLLIAAGAALGFAAGVTQLLTLFSSALAGVVGRIIGAL